MTVPTNVSSVQQLKYDNIQWSTMCANEHQWIPFVSCLVIKNNRKNIFLFILRHIYVTGKNTGSIVIISKQNRWVITDRKSRTEKDEHWSSKNVFWLHRMGVAYCYRRRSFRGLLCWLSGRSWSGRSQRGERLSRCPVVSPSIIRSNYFHSYELNSTQQRTTDAGVWHL